MELRDYLRILRRRWISITLVTLIAVAAAAFVTAQTTPLYQSTAQLFISTSSNDPNAAYQGSLFSTQRVSSYAEAATNFSVAQEVIDDLDLDITPRELSEKVSTTVRPETVLLDLSVTDPDPQEAQRLAQAYSVQMQELVEEYETPPGAENPTLQAQISNPATLPLEPVSPQPVRNIGLALVLGLLLGFGQAVAREVLDNTVKSAEDITEGAGVPVMAGITFDPATSKQPLVSLLGSHEPRVEAFRVLRTNLQFVDVDSPDKAFVVTSSLPGEGKSTTAVNAAITMAQTGQKVLLVDGDLRRPQVANLLSLDPVVGLTTALVGRVSAADAIQHHQHTGLDVLTSGAVPPNPAELLQSHAMADLIKDMRDKYDAIVVDAPPLLPVTDAALIASQLDGALLVVRHGKTTRDQLAGSMERLNAVGANALGVVLNMVPRRRGLGSSYGYGYGYGYGYAPDAGLKGRAGRKQRKLEEKRAKEAAKAAKRSGRRAKGYDAA